jgi:hypothetical protein
VELTTSTWVKFPMPSVGTNPTNPVGTVPNTGGTFPPTPVGKVSTPGGKSQPSRWLMSPPRGTEKFHPPTWNIPPTHRCVESPTPRIRVPILRGRGGRKVSKHMEYSPHSPGGRVLIPSFTVPITTRFTVLTTICGTVHNPWGYSPTSKGYRLHHYGGYSPQPPQWIHTPPPPVVQPHHPGVYMHN